MRPLNIIAMISLWAGYELLWAQVPSYPQQPQQESLIPEEKELLASFKIQAESSLVDWGFCPEAADEFFAPDGPATKIVISARPKPPEEIKRQLWEELKALVGSWKCGLNLFGSYAKINGSKPITLKGCNKSVAVPLDPGDYIVKFLNEEGDSVCCCTTARVEKDRWTVVKCHKCK